MKNHLLLSAILLPMLVFAQGKQSAKAPSLATPVQVGFVSSNLRFSQENNSEVLLQKSMVLTAWKGEKVHAQLAVQSTTKLSSVSISVSDLKAKGKGIIPKQAISTGFVGYVMTDEFKNGCGHRKPQDFDSSLVADPINTTISSIALLENSIQPVWISVQVPAKIQAGVYAGTFTVKADKTYKFSISVKVLDRTLPPPAQWSFTLDLWQHPAAIARVHGVALWSDAHFSHMKSYYNMLAKAGQKNITASIVDEPWNHQTYDDFPGLIKWTKRKDGSWQYDYSLFDKYISFVMDCGITQRINCYSMVPWKIAFPYFDEALGIDTVFTGKIGSPEYNAFWKPMLTDFTRHLKAKGWFHKTAIAMDERPMPAMQAVIALLKEVDKDWKIALAGDYHPEIEADIYDYCIASRWQFPAATLQQRQQQGKLSTWYTCCTENYPNGFTFSPPAEHVWIGWYTAAKGMDGYLRWAYNSWPKNPLQDSRFTAWPAGDTYQIYPGPLKSIRFEKLIEGIQDFEKISILKAEYNRLGNKKRLQELEDALSRFEIEKLAVQSAEKMVLGAKRFLNE
ncbi:DUF4091 domain-containing protein [Flavisolibacter sp. BT320]|nr:DUF4091 domain-containing protein [Flavisolibacter longurius]